jgi:hypothetical protein
MTDVIYDICVPRGTLKLHEPWGTLTGSFRPKKKPEPINRQADVPIGQIPLVAVSAAQNEGSH